MGVGGWGGGAMMRRSVGENEGAGAGASGDSEGERWEGSARRGGWRPKRGAFKRGAFKP
jgi:hypothetical protein